MTDRWWQWLIPVGVVVLSVYIWWDVRRIKRTPVAPPPKPAPLVAPEQADDTGPLSLPGELRWPDPTPQAMTAYDWAQVHEQIALSALNSAAVAANASGAILYAFGGYLIATEFKHWSSWITFPLLIVVAGVFAHYTQKPAKKQYESAVRRREALER